MKTYASILLAIYITAFVVLAASSVGEISKPTETTWGLPVTMFLLLAFPAVMGFIIGQNSRE